MPDNDTINRRPLKSRQQVWPHKLAHFFVGAGMTPNQMSMASVGCAILGAVAYGCVSIWPSARAIFFVFAAVFIQLRLLANLLDGLMAVEEGKKTATGILYNEMPDRVADTLFLVAAGYAAGWPALGWLSSVLALATAYTRVLGSSLGFEQNFCGPMAKQHRMFTLTVGSLLSAVLPYQLVMAVTVGIICIGCVITLLRRTRHLANNLSANHHD